MRRIRYVLYLFLLLWLIAGCVPPTPAPESLTPSPQPTEILPPLKPTPIGECDPLPTLKPQLGKQKYSYNEEDFFIENQVIVTGSKGDVDELFGTVLKNNPQLDLARISEVDLSTWAKYFDEQTLASEGQVASPSGSPDLLMASTNEQTLAPEREAATPSLQVSCSELAISLFHNDGEKIPAEELIGIFRESAGDLKVLIEPNRVVGLRPGLIEGDQASVEGGQASVEGGNAYEDVISATSAFKDQWAFNQIGLDSDLVRSTQEEGTPALVGIFDTSPFEGEGKWRVHWAEPPLDIYVYHPDAVVPLDPSQTATDVRDHGLFVAGLVHGVSENSEIRLFRVLNEQNKGEVGTLINTLFGFGTQVLNDKETLDGTVINLSLGVPLPPNPDEGGSSADLSEVADLENLLLCMHDLGAVIVAAAGNDSDGAVIMEAQAPASFPHVIGVAGTKYGSARACFSNRGDVAAPSGNSGPKNCEPIIGECKTDPNHYPCVLSLSTINSPDTGYAFWAGTSFAAPLVTGQAALLLQTGVDPATATDRITGSAHAGDSALGAGQVDLPDSLSGLPQ